MLAGNKPIPIDNLTLSFDPQIAGEWGDVYPEVDDSDVVAGETHDDPDSEDVEADRATLSAWVASMKGQAKRRR